MSFGSSGFGGFGSNNNQSTGFGGFGSNNNTSGTSGKHFISRFHDGDIKHGVMILGAAMDDDERKRPFEPASLTRAPRHQALVPIPILPAHSVSRIRAAVYSAEVTPALLSEVEVRRNFAGHHNP
jgi:hypothetical protein